MLLSGFHFSDNAAFTRHYANDNWVGAALGGKKSRRPAFVPAPLLLLFINMGGLVIDIYVVYLFRIIVRAINLFRSRNWPLTTGRVLSAERPSFSAYFVAAVTYEYVVDGERYGAMYEKPFLESDSAEEYARKFAKGEKFKVRVNPRDPSLSTSEG
jgi:hypothetical protein